MSSLNFLAFDDRILERCLKFELAVISEKKTIGYVLLYNFHHKMRLLFGAKDGS